MMLKLYSTQLQENKTATDTKRNIIDTKSNGDVNDN